MVSADSSSKEAISSKGNSTPTEGRTCGGDKYTTMDIARWDGGKMGSFTGMRFV